LAVERGADAPYPDAVLDAVSAFCRALAARVPLHPDCVVAMADVPYARPSRFDAEERRVAERARRGLEPPGADGTLRRLGGGGAAEVGVEVRDTANGRAVGMMMRRGFAPGRGMLFVYGHRDYLKFFMRNCFVPIDVAFVRTARGRAFIDEVHTMVPQAGAPPDALRRYPSRAAVRYALEMPGGWFASSGFGRGTRVEGLP
ncbi:MAG: DUF192 domain-containing protein, partial [Planctomycetota bacterium]